MREPQRASIYADPDGQDYEILVFLDESGLLSTSVVQVQDELMRTCGNCGVRMFGFSVRLTSKLKLCQTLMSRSSVLQAHTLKISEHNIMFYSQSQKKGAWSESRCFNKSPCLTEQELLSLPRKDDASSHLSKLLQDSRILKVDVDWDNRLVVTFSNKKQISDLLKQLDTSHRLLSTQKPVFELVPEAGLYVLDCGDRKVDMRDFLHHSEDCCSLLPSQVASRSKVFLGRVMGDAKLRLLYPTLVIASCNFRTL